MNDKTQLIRVSVPSDAPGFTPHPIPVAPAAERCDSVPTLLSDSLPHPPAHASCPVAFPGYEILEEIGRGGMGVVYKARQRSLNRLVALKVILGGPHASPEDKARFRVEAEAAARLNHPNIVEVYDVGEYAGFAFIALELIEGGTLRAWQDGRPVEPRPTARVMAVVARAVQHAHDSGIVHRDLKPANILLTGARSQESGIGMNTGSGISSPTPVPCLRTPPTPKVTDFGLAKAIEGGADLTITGAACGTPNYMAPEQVRGRRVGPAADVYGLGAILFELLTGRPPFVGADAASVMHQILTTAAPPVRKFAPAVPRDLGVIVAKCLEKVPARRYPAPRDVADDLERFLAGHPLLARPVGRLEHGWRWVRRNPMPAAFLAVLAVGCAVTGVLAAALARSVGIERAARAEAEQAQADTARVRDELREALALAESRKAVADQEARRAVEQMGVAEGERGRAHDERQKAEANLRLAGVVIRTTFTAFKTDPRLEGEAFAGYREPLLVSARKYRDGMAACGGETPETFENIAEVSHWLGFLEYLKGNNPGAATEYRRAAAAAELWAARTPDDPEPRSWAADSLVNAGNALFNCGRYAEAEACYREAFRGINEVVGRHPRVEPYRTVAVQAASALAFLYRKQGRNAEWLAACRDGLSLARELLRGPRATAGVFRTLAAVHADLGAALTALGEPDEADCHLAEAVTARRRVLELVAANRQQGGQFTAETATAEAAAAVLDLATHRSAAGQNALAVEGYEAAVGLIEPAAAANPGAVELVVALADAYTRHGEHLRRNRDAAAGARYEQALRLLEGIPEQPPQSAARTAWATATTARGHLLNQTGRHRAAAAVWAELADRAADPEARARGAVFVAQSLLFAGDRKAAAAHADTLAAREFPGWAWYDIGRVWCLVARQAAADPAPNPGERRAEADTAAAKAVVCLGRAKAAGVFRDPHFVHLLETSPEMEPVRGKFDPRE